MSRQSSHPEASPDSLRVLAEEVVFLPTDRDKRLKGEFWARAVDNPFISLDSIDIHTVRKVLNREIGQATWGRPGFKEWFLNKDEARQRLEYLFSLALDAAEQIISNEDPKAQGARVNMIKVIAELGGKNPSSKLPGNLPGAIAGMDKAQLELFLKSNGVSMKLSASKGEPAEQEVLSGQTIDVTPETETP